MDITENIFKDRLLISIAGDSERQLAAKIGVSPGTAHNYLAGKSEPKMSTLKKISKEYNVSLEWLLEGEMSSSQKPVERIVAETRPPYGEKLPPEDEKLAEIRAYIEDVSQDSLRTKRLFVMQFMKCFEDDFSPWSKTRSHATRVAKNEEE